MKSRPLGWLCYLKSKLVGTALNPWPSKKDLWAEKNEIRGKIENYFKYIWKLFQMISFFYSVEFYWVSTNDKIPWRFRMYKNNLCPCTPQVSYMWCQTQWLRMRFMYLWKGTVVLSTSFMLAALLRTREVTKRKCQLRDMLTTLSAKLCNRSIPTLCNKFSLANWMASIPKVRFELGLKVHLPFYFSSFVSVLIPK